MILLDITCKKKIPLTITYFFSILDKNKIEALMRLIILMCFLTSLHSQEIDSLLAMGYRFESELNDKEALKRFEKVLQLDSLHVIAHIHAARLYTQIGFEKEEKIEQENDFNIAIKLSQRVVRIAPTDDAAHLIYAQSLGRLALISGAENKIRLAKQVKEETDIVIKLNPKNDIAWHILGKWHYNFADLNWLARTAANLILGGVPKEATFANAKLAFEKAISIKPESIGHHLELGRTLLKLDKEPEAKRMLEATQLMKEINTSDRQFKKEAQELLNDL